MMTDWRRLMDGPKLYFAIRKNRPSILTDLGDFFKRELLVDE